MPNAKYHHRIPQTYMRAWGENVWVYDKKTCTSDQRNIDSIMGQKFFHSIKAGSIFQTAHSLDCIFGCLDNYSVYLVDNSGLKTLLASKEKLNQFWYAHDDWIIEDGAGKVLSNKPKNVLMTTISQAVDNTIEDEWSSKFESDWANNISEIYKRLREIHSGKEVTLTSEAFDTIIRYFVMFQWRSYAGNEEARNAFEFLMDIVPEIRDMETEKPVHKEDKTISDELWHELLLSSYYKYLHGSGVMQKHYEAYRDKLTLLVMLDSSESLITSDVPCFEHIRSEGYREPLFVALPGLLISLAQKDPDAPNSYRIIELTQDDVESYNKIIFEFGNVIVSKNELDACKYVSDQGED